jgi:hypothetical protein
VFWEGEFSSAHGKMSLIGVFDSLFYSINRVLSPVICILSRRITMSIDDPDKFVLLIEKMEASLPIPVRATPETLKLAETKGERYKPDHQFSIR